jgi:hypothetical protein
MLCSDPVIKNNKYSLINILYFSKIEIKVNNYWQAITPVNKLQIKQCVTYLFL